MPQLPNVKVASFIIDNDDPAPPKVKFNEENAYYTEIRKVHLVGHSKKLNSLLVSYKDGHFDVMAHIDEEISFRGLADIQLHVKRDPLALDIHNINRDAVEQLKAILESKHKVSHFPVMPPPAFSREHIPKLIQKQYFHKGLPEFKSRASKSCPWAISFDSPSPNVFQSGHGPLYDKLCGLFDQRPCWTKLALKNMLNENYTDSDFKKNLTLVAYTFVNGPWRNVWVKYGIDPRISPEFRHFQVLELRNKYSAKKINRTRRWMLDTKMSTGSFVSINDSSLSFQYLTLSYFRNHIFDGERLTDNFFIYQLCDIAYQPVRDHLSKLENTLQTCPTEIDGWYPPTTITTLRELIKSRLEQMLITNSGAEYEYAEVFPSDSLPLCSMENESEDEYEVWA